MARKLSEVAIPGINYAVKVKIEDVLDDLIELQDIEHIVREEEIALGDGRREVVVMADYWNLTVSHDNLLKLISTGAKPLVAALVSLNKEDLPLECRIVKSGQTYIFED